MISFNMMSSEESAQVLAKRAKARRLAQNLTQEGLAKRSGVALGTLKKFEGSGQVSLVSFLKLAVALGDEAALEKLLLEPKFETLDDVLEAASKPQRGRIK